MSPRKIKLFCEHCNKEMETDRICNWCDKLAYPDCCGTEEYECKESVG